jgi:hypothetical protein
MTMSYHVMWDVGITSQIFAKNASQFSAGLDAGSMGVLARPCKWQPNRAETKPSGNLSAKS